MSFTMTFVSSISDIGKDEFEKVQMLKGRESHLWKLDIEERFKYHKDKQKNGK